MPLACMCEIQMIYQQFMSTIFKFTSVSEPSLYYAVKRGVHIVVEQPASSVP